MVLSFVGFFFVVATGGAGIYYEADSLTVKEYITYNWPLANSIPSRHRTHAHSPPRFDPCLLSKSLTLPPLYSNLRKEESLYILTS